MINKISVLLLVVLASFNISLAQQQLQIIGERKISTEKADASFISSQGTPDKCGYAFTMNQAKAKGFNSDAFEARLKTIVDNKINQRPNFTGVVTIPVIFHVLYRSTDPAIGANSPNLAVIKFQAQIDQLNKDYGNLSGSAYGVSADTRIRFCMATVDQSGVALAVPGIDRINAQTRGWTNTATLGTPTNPSPLINYFNNTIKPATYWDPYRFFNVWTADMTNSGLLGFATFPTLSGLAGLSGGETDATAGVVISWQSTGGISSPAQDASYNYGRTLTHEAGHFFGLRHIWGDATCGTDYCADTPPQDDETTGCPPAGTLNGCSPSGPKMFENYMDYSNDACLNTFTADQAARMNAVMDNSPRRKELINSTVCGPIVTNAISFSEATATVSEGGTGTTCPVIKSYTAYITATAAANGPATVTVNTGGTATLGKDYTLSSGTVNFVSGEATKAITINIIDDQALESAETIVLTYSIAGTGVVAGSTKQSITITISDDDFAGTINNTTPIVNIVSQNFDASTAFPSGWTNETLYDGNPSPAFWAVSANSGLGTTGNSAHITNNATTKPNSYTKTTATNAFLYTPVLDATGLSSLNLNFKWICQGEIFQGVDYDYGALGFIPEGLTATSANIQFFNNVFYLNSTIQTANLNLPALFNNKKFRLVFGWFNDNTGGADPAFAIDDVVLTGKSMTVATAVTSDTTFVQYQSQSVNYYSVNASGTNIIAKVTNPSVDLGCVTASVIQAGNGQTAIVTSAGSYLRSNKVIKLTPATANTTASYQATIYFTTAEAAIWGADALNVKILKVKDGISLGGTLTNADAIVITPSVDDQRATKGYIAYTGSFTDGFSQFMIASPLIALPVNLISFDAKVVNKSIALNWVTSQEVNNKGFALERSTDAVNFTKIAWLDGRINSAITSTYTYTDNFVQPGVVYYYRLRQTDLDGKEKLSAVRNAKIEKLVVSVTITPNPAKNSIKVFVAGTNSLADIYVVNMQGQVLRSFKQVNGSNTAATLNISGLPVGMYVVNIALPNETRREKLIIE